MVAQLFIGVDGGGSGCRVLIATATRGLGEGRGGAANVSSDSAGSIASVLAALKQASAAAGVEDLSGAVGHLGLAGVLTSDHAEAIAEAMPFARAIVTDDRPTMITGALGGVDGAVAAIGTGSFIGSKRGAKYACVGGWGLVLGDEASAAWLGRAAMAETLKAQDGLRRHTALSQDIMTHFSNDPNEIVAFAAAATPSGFGRFAPRVSAAAQDGDVLGLALMQGGADYIGEALNVIGHKEGAPLCLTGGLGPAYAPYLPDEFAARITTPKGSALDGAVALARARG